MGVASIEKLGENSLLGLWLIEEPVEVLYKMAKLSPLELEQYQMRKTEIRKKEWLACRTLLREMIGHKVEIQQTEDGKPVLPNEAYQISMSHSGAYASIYLDQTKPVGVDIQKFKPSISAGADFFLHDEELKWVDLNKNPVMHLIWSVKETVFKFADNKNLDFKKDIQLTPFESNQNELIEVTICDRDTVSKVYVQYSFFENYVLTWTV